ncbi:MAG: prenyltransferase [Desulfovibrio sp.]|nr:prenyltransferase [Desulfovibrio sp.]
MKRYVDLIRYRVSLAVTAGSLFGALFYGGPNVIDGVATAIGAGLLCAGSSALNQIQERAYDARMDRTRHRPVASGALSVDHALLVSLVLMISGLVLFSLTGGWPLLLLGLAVPVIYNGMYTPLKPITPMALLVGGVSGALPPLTGWMGAGGSMTAPAIVGVTVVFYLWQVPHFWLLQEKHREDYERAGFATLGKRLPKAFYKPLLALWVAAYFLALGYLAVMNGMASVHWLMPPGLLFMGGWTLFSVAREHNRRAAMTIYASLPLTLAAVLANTL